MPAKRCGCFCGVDQKVRAWRVKYCPLHQSAPELLAACRDILAQIESGKSLGVSKLLHAIEKAEGRVSKP